MTSLNEYATAQGRPAIDSPHADLPRADAAVAYCEGDGCTLFLCDRHFALMSSAGEPLESLHRLPGNTDLVCDECRNDLARANRAKNV